jgi:hypothetical protein
VEEPHELLGRKREGSDSLVNQATERERMFLGARVPPLEGDSPRDRRGNGLRISMFSIIESERPAAHLKLIPSSNDVTIAIMTR